MPFSQNALSISPFRLQVEMGQSILNISGEVVGGKVEIKGTAPVIHSDDLPISIPLHRPMSVSNLEVKGEIDGTFVQVTALRGSMFDGQFNAKGTWDGHTAFQSTGELRGMKVEQILKVLRPNPVRADGTGAMNWKIKGTVLPQKAPSLSGRAQMTIVNGQLIGVDLLQRIEQVLKLKNRLSDRRGVTKFSKFQGELEFLEEQFPLKSILLAGHEKEFLMHGSGHVNRD